MSRRAGSMYPWLPSERRALRSLSSPEKIQTFIDQCTYNSSDELYAPNDVLRLRTAHCLEGALFAAAVFDSIGMPPLLLDLRAVRDDDHILALFRYKGYFGAVAKSNYVGLRYREPIFRTIRELALSYFESYFNERGQKTLREYSTPLDLNTIRLLDWKNAPEAMDLIAQALDDQPHEQVLPAHLLRRLRPVDPWSRAQSKIRRLD
jgi:hypothetical protein